MYLSQLRLYNPLSKTDHDIWEGDDEKCKEAYEINEESIRYVRRNGMKYQQKVEESQAKAQAKYDAAVDDILDSAKSKICLSFVTSKLVNMLR